MYQYALFDLDGTLTDPKLGICTCVQYALADAGIEEPDLDVLEPFIGPPLQDSFQEFYQMTEEQAAKAVTKYRERFETKGLYENEIYPGIPDMLASAKQRGMKLGIASSKPTVFVEKILVHFQIREYFDVVVGSELDGSRSKKEEVVEEALKQLVTSGIKDYDKCVMIGDRRFDIEGAKAHAIKSIGVSYGYAGPDELENAGASYIANSVEELQRLLVGKEKLPPKDEKSSMQSFFKTWQVLFPILLYWTICNIVLIAGVFLIQMFLGTQENVTELLGIEGTGRVSVGLNALAMLTTIPFMYRMYRKDGNPPLTLQLKKSASVDLKKNTKKLPYLLILILGVSVALALNMLLSYISFQNISSNYQETSAMQYSVSIPIGILVYGLIAPIAEELVFRGIVYNRLRGYFMTSIAIGTSAFIFGMYHGNIVQGTYAFLLGTVIAVCYTQFDTILVPILFHAAANISVFVITHDRNIERLFNRPLNCVIFVIISILTFWQLMKIKKD